jgi:K+-sensing histidine kinase KdpD
VFRLTPTEFVLSITAVLLLFLSAVAHSVRWAEVWAPILLFASLAAVSNDLSLWITWHTSRRRPGYGYALTGAVERSLDVSAQRFRLGRLFALVALLVLDPASGIATVMLGAAIAEILKYLLTSRFPIAPCRNRLSASMVMAASEGISLGIAGLFYAALGESFGVSNWTWRQILALVPLFGVYFLTYHALESWLLCSQGFSVFEYFQRNLENILVWGLLPLPLAAILADVYLRLDMLVFGVFSGIVIGLWTVTVLLGEVRRDMEKHLREVHTLNRIGQAIGGSLELDVLLSTLYHQVKSLVEADNFYIAIYDATTDELAFPLVFEDGKRKRYARRRAGNGLTEYVIRERKPLLINENTGQIVARLGLEMMGQPALSWLGVPMMVGDRVLGVIAVQSFNRPYAYEEKDVAFFSTLAAQAAVALENAQLYGQMRRRTAELALLNTFSTAVSTTLDLDQVSQIIVASIMPVMVCQKSALFLLNEPDGRLYLSASQGLGDAFLQSHLWQEEDFLQHTRDENIIIVPDVMTSDRPAVELELARREGYQALAQAALMTQKEPIGVLAIYYDHAHHFDLAERDLLTTFANQAASAVANARLFSRTDQALARRVEELSAIERIGRELVSALEPQRVLDLVLDQAMRATGATQGCIAMLGATPDSLAIVAQQGYATPVAQAFLSEPHRLNTGVVGRVLQSGQLALVPDVREDPEYVALDPAILGQLTVPISREDVTLGAINLESDHVNGFDAQDADFVTQLATQAVVALQNAQLFQERSQRVEELSLLYQASLSLASSLEYQEVFEIISRLARNITNSDTVTLYLYDRGSEQFVRVSTQGYPIGQSDATIVRPQGLTRAIVETNRPVLVEDTQTYPGINPAVIQSGIRSIIGVPIISRGEVLGVLYVNHRQPHAYTENDVRVVSALANQAGATIANVSLFSQVSEARDRLEAIINSTKEGILVLDNAHRVVIANAQMERFVELRRQQLVGCTVDELMQNHPGSMMNLLGFSANQLRDWVMRLDTHPMEVLRTFQTPVSSEAPGAAAAARFTELFSTPVLDETQQVIGRLLVFRDITEEKELEQTREDLIGMMVHDLRSPLTAVLSGLEMIQEFALGEIGDPLAVQAAEVAKRSCENMLILVNSLLDISRLESGRMPLERAPAPFAPLVRSAITHLSPLAVEKDVLIETDLPPDLPLVEMDNEKIGRVLINLLDNALKFTPIGERVILRARQQNGDRGDVVLCSVSDAGPGIPAEYHEKIFDRFAQVRGQAVPRGRRGTGLGLAFCKLAVEAHGGRIWVESESGRGSTFFFTLPVADIERWLGE